MHYKIYFGDKPVYLLNALDPELVRSLDQENILYVNEFSDDVINSTLASIRSDSTDAVIFFHHDLSTLKEKFWKQFTIIQAGGGCIHNEQQETLCIFRLGRWDLPKGKLDAGESLEACAVREVQEETGLEQVQLEKHLITTYHTYRQDGKDILKETYWYSMTASGKATLVAQVEEDISRVEWIKADDMQKVLDNTYQAVKDVLAISSRL